jgi:peptidoglycan-associated lipoprotein
MEMLKFGKFAALALAMAVAVGCSSKGGDNAGQGAAVDPNAGYNANNGAVDGSLSEEAALRAITTFYFEYDSSDLKPEAMRSLDVHAKDLKANGAAQLELVSYGEERPVATGNDEQSWAQNRRVELRK